MPERSDETNADPLAQVARNGLAIRTARSGALTVTSQGMQFLLSSVGTVILARLLTPADYGLVAMVTVLLGFISIFRDMGLSEATVQRQNISHGQISTLFWINVGFGILIMCVVVALAPAVEWFYGTASLASLTVAYAVGFPISAAAVQHAALLRRQMRFVVLAMAEIGSLSAGLLATILLAWFGARYWALVAGRLTEALSFCVGVWLGSGWRPGLPRRNQDVRSMLAFGGNLTGFSIVNYVARNIDNLLIGKAWGAQQLGLYSKAYTLLLLPLRQINNPIGAVAVPSLSRVADDPERYRRAYLRMLEKITILTMPGTAFLIATSDWLVRLVLGPQWTEASRLFAILGVSALVQPVANTAGWLFVSQGRTRQLLQWGLVGSTLLVVAIVVGLPWGAAGVATAYSGVSLVVVTPLLAWFVGRQGPVRAMDLYRTAAPAAWAAMSVLVVLAALRQWWLRTGALPGLLVCFGCTLFVTYGVLYSSARGRRALGDIWVTGRALLGSR